MLPKIKHRIIMTTLPSTREKVRFRPMLGSEEKLLLVAKETDERDEILTSVKQVVANCVLDEGFDPDAAPIFDIEWLFIQIRIESIGPVSRVAYIDGSDGKQYQFEVDLTRVAIDGETKTDPIKVDEDVAITLRWPSVSDYTDPRVADAESDGEVAHFLAVRSLDKVYHGDEEIDCSTESYDEVNEFVSSLDVDAYKKLIDHVASVPVLRYSIEYTNSKGEEREIVLNNLTDFFRFR